MKPRTIDIFGVPAHMVDFGMSEAIVKDLVDNGEVQQYIVALNAEKIMMARKNAGIMCILRSAYLLIPDGVGVSLASRILYRKSVPRVPGYDFFLALVADAAQTGKSVFLLGATADIVAAASTRLSEKFPKLRIVGHHHGYFTVDEPVVEAVNSKRPDFLFVGMGSPRQEMWIHRNIKRLDVKVCFGVGGSFDVVAGKARLAPAVIRRLGFEFVYRLVRYPRRLQRQLVFPDFLASLLAERTGLAKKYGAMSGSDLGS